MSRFLRTSADPGAISSACRNCSIASSRCPLRASRIPGWFSASGRSGCSARDQQAGEVVVRHPAPGVAAEGGAVERLGVRVQVALFPGQRGEDGEDGYRKRLACASRQGRQRRRCQRDDADARQVLEVIGDEREEERVDVEEAEGGKQRTKEEERRGERAGKALAPRPQSTDGYECRRRVEVLRESDRIDV